MLASRRGILFGLGASAVVAPAVVRASSLMKIKSLDPVRTLRFSADGIYLLDERKCSISVIESSGDWFAGMAQAVAGADAQSLRGGHLKFISGRKARSEMELACLRDKSVLLLRSDLSEPLATTFRGIEIDTVQ